MRRLRQASLIARRSPICCILDCREGPSRAELEAPATSRRHYRRDRRRLRPPAGRRFRLLSAGAAGGAPRLDGLALRAAHRLGMGACWVLARTPPRPAHGLAAPDPAGGDGRQRSARADAAHGPRAGAARSHFPRPLCHRPRHGGSREASPARSSRCRSNFETVEGADDLAIEYASRRSGACAFGVTAYELAAFGVPAIYLVSHRRSCAVGLGLRACRHGNFARRGRWR